MQKKGKELSISNPGTIRVTKEEFYTGGNSDPRNPNILKIFGFVNVGERAGSGVDKIIIGPDDVSKEALIKRCKKWSPYSSIAARYLYRALDMGFTKEEFHLYK